MASDDSADETPFTDCSGSETQKASSTGRRRQASVPEMVKRAAESRKAKRSAPDRGSKSPRDPALPAAKRPLAGPAEPAGVELSASALASIRQLLDASIASVISAFDAKFERMEHRLTVLESEVMDKDIEIRRLGEQLSQQVEINSDLHAQVESMDLNRRLSSLIFTCDDFGQRSVNENIEEKVVFLLNNRIPGLKLTVTDIHAAHRLQRDDKVIVKFVRRSLRDAIYDARFGLAPTATRAAGVGSGRRDERRPSTLYISESLTARNQSLFNQLLQARRSSNGTKVASVFSRRGLVFCRTVRGGPNIRVPDETALRRIIGVDDAGRHPSANARRPAGERRGGEPGGSMSARAGSGPGPRPGSPRASGTPAAGVPMELAGAAATEGVPAAGPGGVHLGGGGGKWWGPQPTAGSSLDLF